MDGKVIKMTGKERKGRRDVVRGYRKCYAKKSALDVLKGETVKEWCERK